MRRYFLHLRYRDGVAMDEDGDDRPDSDACARMSGRRRDLMRHARLAAITDRRACIFEVTDETDSRVLTLPFS